MLSYYNDTEESEVNRARKSKCDAAWLGDDARSRRGPRKVQVAKN
jgi:hypothetical protein